MLMNRRFNNVVSNAIAEQNTQSQSVNNYHKIWKVVNAIPIGKVASYGQVADLAGLPGRARLVGKSLQHIPKDTGVAWHRVLRSSGQIAFAKGSAQALSQTALLQDDGVVVLSHRVKLKEFQWCPDLGELLLLEH